MVKPADQTYSSSALGHWVTNWDSLGLLSDGAIPIDCDSKSGRFLKQLVFLTLTYSQKKMSVFRSSRDQMKALKMCKKGILHNRSSLSLQMDFQSIMGSNVILTLYF